MALVQDIRLTTKNCVCTTSESINQIQTYIYRCCDKMYRRKKKWFLHPKRSKDLGTGSGVSRAGRVHKKKAQCCIHKQKESSKSKYCIFRD